MNFRSFTKKTVERAFGFQIIPFMFEWFPSMLVIYEIGT